MCPILLKLPVVRFYIFGLALIFSFYAIKQRFYISELHTSWIRSFNWILSQVVSPANGFP